MTGRAFISYSTPPAILSAHRDRGYTSYQLELHRAAIERAERRRRALATALPKPAGIENRVDDAAVALATPSSIAAPLPGMGRDIDPGPVFAPVVERFEAVAERCRTDLAKRTARFAEIHAANGRTGEPPKPRLRIEDIQRVVAARYGVARSDLTGPHREQILVKPRQIAMYLAKSLTMRSLPGIGRKFGNRDHTTVLHGVRKMQELSREKADFRAEIEELRFALTGELPPTVKPPIKAKRVGVTGVAPRILTAMCGGASTSHEIAAVLDLSIACVTGAIPGLLRTGKITRVRWVKPVGRRHGYLIYALAESET